MNLHGKNRKKKHYIGIGGEIAENLINIAVFIGLTPYISVFACVCVRVWVLF